MSCMYGKGACVENVPSRIICGSYFFRPISNVLSVVRLLLADVHPQKVEHPKMFPFRGASAHLSSAMYVFIQLFSSDLCLQGQLSAAAPHLSRLILFPCVDSVSTAITVKFPLRPWSEAWCTIIHVLRPKGYQRDFPEFMYLTKRVPRRRKGWKTVSGSADVR